VDMNLGTEKAIEKWERYAEIFTTGYGEQGDLHRVVLLNPTLLSLLPSLVGKRVLDAGCGEGYLSRMLIKLGASSVVGVDYSSRMIQLAQDKTPQELCVEYKHGNCENLNFLQDKSFDIIVSNMVIHDLANYESAIHEMYRLLADEGIFIFSIPHPCFASPGSGWVKSDTGEKLYRKVDNYFYEGEYEQIFPLDQEDKLLYFHRTITSYVNAIVSAGFRLEAMIEPKPSDEMLLKYPSFKEDLRCSDFLVFHLKK